MISTQELSALITKASTEYDAYSKDREWVMLSKHFHDFWHQRILSDDLGEISDADCDEIIQILDRNAKGNTKNSEVIARAMVAQGAWRRMFNELHVNKELASHVTNILTEANPLNKANYIDMFYKFNEGQRNHLTGPSGNVICAFIAAYNPIDNLSVISLKDRRSIIEYFGLTVPFVWDGASVGTRIVGSNKVIIDGFHTRGLKGSARTISRFFYSNDVKALWRGEHTIKQIGKDVSVIIPEDTEDDGSDKRNVGTTRESIHIQALIAMIGATMGYQIWLPRNDRERVQKVWKAKPGELLDDLPLGYEQATIKTIAQIDVLWMSERFIVRAFEVEHTTSIYSGLLRMADLVALQPNINIKLHIVAPSERRDKVLIEIKRPVFTTLRGGALSKMCTYLSYESINEISEDKHLSHLSDEVIEDYEESADME